MASVNFEFLGNECHGFLASVHGAFNLEMYLIVGRFSSNLETVRLISRSITYLKRLKYRIKAKKIIAVFKVEELSLINNSTSI